MNLLRVLRGEIFAAALVLGAPGAFAQGRPPVITNQPQSQLVVTGSVVAFSVGVSSPTTPPRFQWLRNGVSLPGETNASLILTNARPAQSGGYQAQVANAAGSVTSTNALLITAEVQASPVAISLGASATLRAFLAGGPAGDPTTTFQWYQGSKALAGATRSQLALTNAQLADAGAYTVVLSNSVGRLGLPAPLEIDTRFTKITDSPLGTEQGISTEAAWGDYDGDGLIDLFVARADVDGAIGNRLYHNEGQGRFTAVTAGPVAEDHGVSMGPAWGDYDNDGRLDLFVGNGTPLWTGQPTNYLYRGLPGGGFQKITQGELLTGMRWSGPAAWVDYDGDGLLDLFSTSGIYEPGMSAPGRGYLFHSQGDGSFTLMNEPPIGTDRTLAEFHTSAWADSNDDGLPELLLVAKTEIFQYVQNPDGSFRRVASGITDGGGSLGGPAWADFDNDGDLDLYLRLEDHESLLFRNLGLGASSEPIFQRTSLGRFPSHGPSWGDFDNDGYLDLFISMYDATGNHVLRNNRDGTLSRIPLGSLTSDLGNSFGGQWGDYDNDGFLDLFVFNGGTIGPKQVNFLYHNNGNANRWLGLRLIGRVSNRSALGAKVRVRATIWDREIWQRRDLGGHTRAQDDTRAHFGLGDADAAEIVRIEWPSGIIQELRDVPARQFLTVTEEGVGILPFHQALIPGSNAVFRAVTTLTAPVHHQWQFNGTDLPGETNRTLTISAGAADQAGAYTVTVSTAEGTERLTSQPSELRWDGPPVLATQPGSQLVAIGDKALLTIATVPSARPLAYQWFRNDAALPGQTNATLIRPASLDTAILGDYRVVVANTAGSVTSAVATVGLLSWDGPAQASLGTNLTLRANVTPLQSDETYQWYRDGMLLSGQTGAALTIDPFTLTDAATYGLTVANRLGRATYAAAVGIHPLPFLERITNSPVATDVGGARAGSWGDYDGDGLLDLFVARRAEQGESLSLLYHNDGGGSFRRVTGVDLLTRIGSAHMGTWGDYDNDGNLDLFVGVEPTNHTAGTTNLLLRNLGSGRFDRIQSGLPVTALPTAGNVTWVDYDRDGRLDLFTPGAWHGWGAAARALLIRGLGVGEFALIDDPPLADTFINTDPGWAAWGDYDDDGLPDFLVTDHGNKHQYHQDSFGLFRRVSSAITDETVNHLGLGWGDYDNDGDLDLLLIDAGYDTASAHVLFRNLGEGRFERRVLDRARLAMTGAWVDYDNDGFLDVFITNHEVFAPQPNELYRNNRDGTFTRIRGGRPVQDLGNSWGCSWADYDNNGFMDLIVANGGHVGGQTNFLYRNHGNTNRWLAFNLVGKISNRAALGTKVRVLARIWGQETWQRRDVGGSAAATEGDPRPHFGLGDADVADVVRIEWPSGIIQELHNVAAKQFLTVTEEGVGVLPFHQRLVSGSNVVFRAATTLSSPVRYQWQFNGINLPGETNATLSLVDARQSHAGAYSVTVSTADGSERLTSEASLLNWEGPPIIVGHPRSQLVAEGAEATLTVDVLPSASALSYQWLRDDAPVPGATNASLHFAGVASTNAGTYRVDVANASGRSSSLSVVLGVASIGVSPATFSIGASATVTAQVTPASTATYQWSRQGSPVPSGTNAILRIAAAQADDAQAYQIRIATLYDEQLVPVTLPLDPTFTKITDGPVVQPWDGWVGAAWVDFDNDDDVDLFLPPSRFAPTNSLSRLFRNDGRGVFTRLTSNEVGSLVARPGAWGNSAWADYDNDGWLDTWVSRWNGVYTPLGGPVGGLFRNGGPSGFQFLTVIPSEGSTGPGAWGDFDNDGWVDLFVATARDSAGETHSLYRNQADGTFTPVSDSPITTQYATQSEGGAWADYDGDGDLDLVVPIGTDYLEFWRPPGIRLYRNDGSARFTDVPLYDPASPNAITNNVYWGHLNWADYDNDGRLDFVVSAFESPYRLFRNRGDGHFDVWPLNAANSNQGRPAWGDFDNDGDLDLYLPRSYRTRRANEMWVNDGAGTFTRISLGSLTGDVLYSRDAVWGDYDNDGFLDLFVGAAGGVDPNRLYHNNGNSNAWLMVRLRGVLSNRAAIGAKVRVRATFGGRTVWQLREIPGGNGSQDDLRAHFGLRNAKLAEVVRIEWPSGIIQELRDVPPRQILTVTEDGVGVLPFHQVIAAGGNAVFRAATTLPQPARYQWQFSGTDLPGQTNAILSLVDGRTNQVGGYSVIVSTLDGSQRQVSEASRLNWDGPPVITLQPVSQFVAAGANAVFTVEVLPGVSAVTYQWRRYGWVLDGATNATLRVTNVTASVAGEYSVEVANAAGRVTSSSVVLAVPSIRHAATFSIGASATVTARVTPATTETYQWSRHGSPVPSGTNAILRIAAAQADDAQAYQVRITTPYGEQLVPVTLPLDPTFTKITESPVATDQGISTEAAWGDYDGDGLVDLFVARADVGDAIGNRLYHNEGQGRFTAVTVGPVAEDHGVSMGPAWGDFDNDGRLDLFVGNGSRIAYRQPTNYLYRGLPGGAFQKITQGELLTGMRWSGPAAWVDYDRDGLLDLFSTSGIYAVGASQPGRGYLFHSQGEGFFSLMNEPPIGTDQTLGDFHSSAWADSNDDGLPELLLVARTEIFQYIQNPDGSFRRVASAITDGGEYRVAPAWADFDNDGDLDLCLQLEGQESLLFRNLGLGASGEPIFQRTSLGEFPSFSANWGDYDNDGYLDLFISMYDATGNHVLRNNRDGTLSRIPLGSLTSDLGNSYGGQWGDYDNDGFLDLFVFNGGMIGSKQANFLYQNNGNTHRWLGFRLIGRVSNHSALGAKVRVRALIWGREVWQRRDLGGNTHAQDDTRAHFGLGDADVADVVRIEWPSGIIQELRDVAAMQYLTVTEEGVGVLPLYQTVVPGSTAVFRAATTLPGPARYQWRRNGVELLGETNQTLTIVAATALQAGAYSVAVRGTDGPALASEPSYLAPEGPPTITAFESAQTALVGSTVTLAVSAAGIPPLSYQWSRDGQPIAGGQSARLTLSAVQVSDAGRYTVRVSGVTGVTSSPEAELRIVTDVPSAVLVTTVAGSGEAGYRDGLALAARFNQPNGAWVDAEGRVYVGEAINHTIRRLRPDGVVETLAGSPPGGHVDGPPHLARFNAPLGVCISPTGDIYVADFSNHRVRKIIFSGVVTLAGTGVIDYFDGPASIARFDSPNDLVVDPAANVFVTEFGNHTIRRIAPDGTVSTFAGDGTPGIADGVGTAARFNQPGGIARAPDGTLYVSEWSGRRVRKVTTAGRVTWLAGSGERGFLDGPAATARFTEPDGIAVDPAGNVYVADQGSHAIRRIAPDGTVTTIAGNGEEGFADGDGRRARFRYPTGLGLAPDGSLYVTDGGNHRIRRIQFLKAPEIVGQPTPAAVAVGGAATFSVSVLGTPPLALQWQRDGVDIPGATGTTLTVPGASMEQAGSYAVLIRNPVGAVRSAEAALRLRPVLTVVSRPGGIRLFEIDGGFPGPWVIEASADLGVWHPIGTMQLEAGRWVLRVMVPGAEPAFYRAISP